MTDLRTLLAPTSRLLCAALLTAAAFSQAQAADPVAKPAAAKPAAAPAKTAPATAPAATGAKTPVEDPSTLILSDTLNYDDIKKQSIFTGNVVMTRGLLTLHSDGLEMHEDAAGNQFGTATANKGKIVTIRQERPETFEVIEGTGLRAEYDSANSTFDLIGQAIVTRFICDKPFDTIRGDRVRYNDKTGIYQAFGGPNSSAPGGRVRSVAEPRSRTDAAIAECRKASQSKKAR